MTRLELIQTGFAPITHPYRPSEYGMLEAAKRQLGSIPWAVVPDEQEPTHLSLWRTGVKKVAGEDAE